MENYQRGIPSILSFCVKEDIPIEMRKYVGHTYFFRAKIYVFFLYFKIVVVANPRLDALFRMRSSTAQSRKSHDSSVEILDYPARKRKILRNFHFILPKFYFGFPWRIFVSSLEIFDFLGGGDWNQLRCKSSYRVALYRFVARI